MVGTYVRAELAAERARMVRAGAAPSSLAYLDHLEQASGEALRRAVARPIGIDVSPGFWYRLHEAVEHDGL